MRAVGYIRVSTEDQVKGVSLDAQEAKIREYCRYKDLELVEILRDAGISGSKNRNREGFATIFSRIEQNGISAVVIYSLDRLSRDMLTLLAFERLLNECDIKLHTVDGLIDTSTSSGFMNYAMKAFMGEMERRQVKERTVNALQYKKANGEVTGQIPYGFTREGDDLVEMPQEQAIKARANELYSEGHIVSTVARMLNDEGYATRNGSKWSRKQTQRLLDNYAVVYNKVSRLPKTIQNFIMEIA